METTVSKPCTTLNIATSNGPLAQIWLASNMSIVSRNSALQTSIPNSAHEIAKAAGCDLNDDSNTSSHSPSVETITLRTSGELLHGIVRVYSKQAGFLLSDIKDTLIKISSLFKTSSKINVTISKTTTVTRIEQLVLEDVVTEKEVLITPSLDFLDDNKVVSGLMAKEDTMNRQVQGATAALTTGAAPWDTSLEVGRRYNPDETFDQNSSVLDLDFDISNSHTTDTNNNNKSSWLEGTHNSQHTTNFGSNDILNNNNGDDNDFPMDDGENVDWNLGINENNDEHMDGEMSDASIELGRREDTIDNAETTNFGFDLDIGKDNDENVIEETTRLNIETSHKREPRRVKRNPALVHTITIQNDDTQELSNDQLKETSDSIETSETNAPQLTLKLTQKRLWEQMSQNLDFLPPAIVDNLINYQQLKKQKLTDDEIEEEEPLFDISLGLDGDIGNISNVDENQESEGQRENVGESNVDITLQEDITLDLSSSQSDDSTPTAIEPQHDQVKLLSGEVVSKATVDMAETLRLETGHNESITFNNILSKQYNKEIEQEKASETELNRKQVSARFFDMLTLATSDCIDIKQDGTFDEITIETKAPLFEKFITA